MYHELGVGRGDVRGWRSAIASNAVRVRADVSFAVVDGFMVVLAYLGASFLLLLDTRVSDPTQYLRGIVLILPAVVAVHVVANVLAGAYGHVWEYASISEARRVVTGGAVAVLVLVLATTADGFFTGREYLVPRSVLLIGGTFAMLGMGLLRFRTRLFAFKRSGGEIGFRRALVVGTGPSGAVFAQAAGRIDGGLRVLGFVETDADIHQSRRWLAGSPILGGLEDLPALVEQFDVDEVVIASADDTVVRQVVDLCVDNDARLRIVPRLDAPVDGGSAAIDIRDVEVADLLPRPTVTTDLGSVAELLAGKRVLVTGAGGSIGAEILQQVLGFAPASVAALDHDETHLHDALLGIDDPSLVTPVLCDIRERARVVRLFEEWRPEIVFHAAAHKHVPILEACPEEAMKTNVTGTGYLIEASRAYGVERFVLISTDKAVQPTSVMGASKRVAEMLIQAESMGPATGVFTAVRFGNVLGSRGSVVPTFVRQISSGRPVTITDREMTRYFMTTDEAVQLVLQASAMAEGGEVFVLDMGEPIKIIDLAHRLIRLAGLVPGRDIQVIETGRRPGEKLFEQLAHEPLEQSRHPKIGVARPTMPGPIILFDALRSASEAAERSEGMAVKEILLALACQTWDGDEVIDLRERASLTAWI